MRTIDGYEIMKTLERMISNDDKGMLELNSRIALESLIYDEGVLEAEMNKPEEIYEEFGKELIEKFPDLRDLSKEDRIDWLYDEANLEVIIDFLGENISNIVDIYDYVNVFSTLTREDIVGAVEKLKFSQTDLQTFINDGDWTTKLIDADLEANGFDKTILNNAQSVLRSLEVDAMIEAYNDQTIALKFIR